MPLADVATTSLSQGSRDAIREKTGGDLRNNVHGVDVFIDDPGVGFLTINAQGQALADPDPFLSDLNALHAVAANESQRVKDVILLLNTALMQPNPVAQIVFAFSAIEGLGQERSWSDDQKRLLAHLAALAETSTLATPTERAEVSTAIRKCNRYRLREGVVHLLEDLALAHLKKPYDALCVERNQLIHGLAPKPGIDYSDFARRTLNLCGTVLLKAIATEIPLADRYVDRFYELR